MAQGQHRGQHFLHVDVEDLEPSGTILTLESADIVPPELCLLGERNVAGVKIQRHS